MNISKFVAPEIIFGRGSLSQLVESVLRIGASKVFLVSDEGVMKAGWVDREKLLEQLTGVDSSKLNYYVELKKRNQEVLKQNSRLEILHQLARDINIDMSITDIVGTRIRNCRR